jgi:hypothetical protein
LALGPPSGALLDSPNTATLTIQDDDPPPSVSFSGSNYEVSENKGPAVITATLSAASGFTVTVNYAAGPGGTATAGSDYIAVSNTLTFPLGSTIATFPVPIINDTLYEPDETVALTLTNPSHATLGAPYTATLTIHSDDPPHLYLPLLMRDYFSCYTGTSEIEPNDTYLQATGPLCFGSSVAGGYSTGPNLDNDYYLLSVPTPSAFTVALNASGNTAGLQLQLYYQAVSGGSIVGYAGDAPFQVHCPNNSPYPNACAGAAGNYYIRVLMPAGYAGSGYTLTVTSP